MELNSKKLLAGLKKAQSSISSAVQSGVLKNISIKFTAQNELEIVGTDGNSLSMARIPIIAITDDEEKNSLLDKKILFESKNFTDYLKKNKNTLCILNVDTEKNLINIDNVVYTPIFTDGQYPQYEQLFNYDEKKNCKQNDLPQETYKIGFSKAILKSLLSAIDTDSIIFELNLNSNLSAQRIYTNDYNDNSMTLIMPIKLN